MGRAVVDSYVHYIESAAHLLPLSAKVDILLFLLNIKPFVRTQIRASCLAIKPIEEWATSERISCVIDCGKRAYFGYDYKLLQKVVAVDLSYDPHELHLGQLLGYPICCCKKIVEVGESNIDQYEESLSLELFFSEFQLIHPQTYREGKAFISHVPCGTECGSSLKQAQQFRAFILEHQDNDVFKPWIEELEKYQLL